MFINGPNKIIKMNNAHMIHHQHNQQWSDNNKMQICFKYSPTLDLNELRAVNKSQNFYQVFPSAAENISIIIILNSENFYLQSCTLCHLTCKNGVKERKKPHLPWRPVNLNVSVQRQFHLPPSLFTCLGWIWWKILTLDWIKKKFFCHTEKLYFWSLSIFV